MPVGIVTWISKWGIGELIGWLNNILADMSGRRKKGGGS